MSICISGKLLALWTRSDRFIKPHPAWPTVGPMPSLRCGHCEKLFQYRETIVVLRETGSGVVAELETELEAGTVEGGSLRASRQVPLSIANAVMREQEPEQWPALPWLNREVSLRGLQVS
jgi:hypothetical protein